MGVPEGLALSDADRVTVQAELEASSPSTSASTGSCSTRSPPTPTSTPATHWVRSPRPRWSATAATTPARPTTAPSPSPGRSPAPPSHPGTAAATSASATTRTSTTPSTRCSTTPPHPIRRQCGSAHPLGARLRASGRRHRPPTPSSTAEPETHTSTAGRLRGGLLVVGDHTATARDGLATGVATLRSDRRRRRDDHYPARISFPHRTGPPRVRRRSTRAATRSAVAGAHRPRPRGYGEDGGVNDQHPRRHHASISWLETAGGRNRADGGRSPARWPSTTVPAPTDDRPRRCRR